MVQHDAFEVPCCHMGGHAGVQQPLGGNAPLRQFTKMDRVDLGHAHIDGPIAVAAHHMRAHARLDLQDGPQDVRVHAVALCSRHQALICSEDRGGLQWDFSVGWHGGPGQQAEAKDQAAMTVKLQQSGCRLILKRPLKNR